MDRYMYLLFTLIFVAIALVVFILRPDLRRFMLVAGVLGGIVGVMSEYWYFQDYWRPPTLFGTAVPSLEDFLFGFAFTALGVTIGPLLFRRRQTPAQKDILRRVLRIGGLAIIANIIFVDILHVHSILVSYAIFVSIIVTGLIIHPYLWKAAVVTSVIVTSIGVLAYLLCFGVLDTEYLNRYYLLSGNPLSPNLGGFMPLTELFWYLLCGASNAVVYELLNARKNTVQQAFQPGA